MKRFLVHIGIMSVCLLVLLAVIFSCSGEQGEGVTHSGSCRYQVLSDVYSPNAGVVPRFHLKAVGKKDDDSPLVMVYYQYMLRSVGEAACELDVRVLDTPHPGYTPLLCSPTGEFEISVPVWNMECLTFLFQGEKLTTYERLNHS